MRSNNKHTVEELERYIQLYFNEGISYKRIKKQFGLLLSESVFGQKVLRYQTYGLKGIEAKLRNNKYSNKFKMKVIQEHIDEKTPIRQLARKYNVPSDSTVRNWIIRYTKGKK